MPDKGHLCLFFCLGKGGRKMGFLSKIFGMITKGGSSAEICCYYWMLDEPTCPKSIIEK